MAKDSQRLRLNILGVVALSLLGALFARLWYLQVLTEQEFQEQAEANVTREVAIQAPRGRIFDAKGRVLVDNDTTLVVAMDAFILRDQLPGRDERAALALRLATEISGAGTLTKAISIFDAMNDPKYGPFEKIPIAEGVTDEFKVWLAERGDEFPGIEIEQITVRHYPYGTLAAHLLGYVGAINETEFERRAGAQKPYQRSDEIGKAGVELAYEDVLRGVPGTRTIEVDAKGNLIREISSVDPLPGTDIQLTVDIDVQALVEEQLASGLEFARTQQEREKGFFPAPAGAIVVLDPDGAEIIAMASYPSYDPSEFVAGISPEQFAALLDEENQSPLNNRAIQGLYSPGSTFKPFTIYAALNTGLMGPRGRITEFSPINDPGYFIIPNCTGGCEFQNAGRNPYGAVDLRRAITVSSDVYFYNLAWLFETAPGVPRESIQTNARSFGFGALSGVPLAYEAAGLMPDPELMRQRHEEFPVLFPEGEWRAGNTINTAIGQGDMGVTPLQLANAYATFANGGTLYAPNVATAALDPATGEPLVEYGHRELSKLYLPDPIWRPILDGLIGVTADDEGTAAEAFQGFPLADWPVAAKTGTAEQLGKFDTAVFAAYGPVADPEYTVVVLLEEAGFGGDVAAPVARRILEPLATDSLRPAEPVDPAYRAALGLPAVPVEEDGQELAQGAPVEGGAG